MMRAKPASSMQKTYDDCYLICSTAVYFESQNNEAEALRSWRNALDQIYYHNAYRMPTSYRPRTETERALQESLRQMELQCKERVDLLDALQQSRKDAASSSSTSLSNGANTPTHANTASASSSSQYLSLSSSQQQQERQDRYDRHDSKDRRDRYERHERQDYPASGPWLGDGTIAPTNYEDIAKPPALPSRHPPKRPSYTTRASSGSDTLRAATLSPPSTLHPVSSHQSGSRSPSPEKRGGMLRTLRSGAKERQSSGKVALASTLRTKPPAAAKAATQAWGHSKRASLGSVDFPSPSPSTTLTTWDPYTRRLVERPVSPAPLPPPPVPPPPPPHSSSSRTLNIIRPPSPSDYFVSQPENQSLNPLQPTNPYNNPAQSPASREIGPPDPISQPLPRAPSPPTNTRLRRQSPPRLPSYRKEYPTPAPSKYTKPPNARPPVPSAPSQSSIAKPKSKPPPPPIPRKAVHASSAAISRRPLDDQIHGVLSSEESHSSGIDAPQKVRRKKKPADAITSTPKLEASSPEISSDAELPDQVTSDSDGWDAKVAHLLKNLPKGVDEAASKQILNEIVIKGDQVHWSDVAGLEIAKSALKENVVYPFLRPDLFMGLREPARGMLLFGPPGTGKTMLARAVATESKSTFFAISASSLTSKYLGESEKLVRALFTIAKCLAPSIIFVDEIDSLLSARGGNSEHEATRRIKTEFLIQWSDLAKAAAGRETTEGDASRVLVLAATNLPWAVDEAARRRFVRRQYIPLPEDWVRKEQFKTLLSAQKHSMDEAELDELVARTDGFSGSDITALAKDAAMGPLRSLGEKLLHMSPEDIRPIQFGDFEASLGTIRPSVSKEGLKEFEDWAREFGERGG